MYSLSLLTPFCSPLPTSPALMPGNGSVVILHLRKAGNHYSILLLCSALSHNYDQLVLIVYCSGCPYLYFSKFQFDLLIYLAI